MATFQRVPSARRRHGFQTHEMLDDDHDPHAKPRRPSLAHRYDHRARRPGACATASDADRSVPLIFKWYERDFDSQGGLTSPPVRRGSRHNAAVGHLLGSRRRQDDWHLNDAEPTQSSSAPMSHLDPESSSGNPGPPAESRCSCGFSCSCGLGEASAHHATYAGVKRDWQSQPLSRRPNPAATA